MLYILVSCCYLYFCLFSTTFYPGNQLSRRDDLESIAYIIIRFLRGSLPWENVPGDGVNKSNNHRLIRSVKMSTPLAELCKDIPPVFGEFLQYARRMQFSEDPDIPKWRAKFREVYVERGYDQEVSVRVRVCVW